MKVIRKTPSAVDETVSAATETPKPRMVTATVSQGYETNLHIRLVPGRDIAITPAARTCRPRQGAPRRDADPLALPPDLTDKLKKADKAVIAWLAKDQANARAFLANPAKALQSAGVELSRAEQKAIARVHSEIGEAAAVAPGVTVADLKVDAYTRGRIGKIRPSTTPQDDSGNDAGCAKE